MSQEKIIIVTEFSIAEHFLNGLFSIIYFRLTIFECKIQYIKWPNA